MIKRIAVTGANGFIGRHLCRHLSESDYNVISITRTTNTKIDNKTIRRVAADLADPEETNCIFEGCDAVIHLAGRAHVLNDISEDPRAEFYRANVDITRNLILSAAQAGVMRFVFVSSIGVNGSHSENIPFLESDKENPCDFYSESKFKAEQLVRSQAKQCGIEFVIVRPPLVFGPDAPGNFELMMKLAANSLPVPFGRLSARRNLISVWNLADFLRVCATHPLAAGETFLAADEQNVMVPEIFKYLGVGMNKRQYVLPIPECIIRGTAFLLGKSKMFEKLNAELRVDITKAKTVLGWKPPFSSFKSLEKTGKEYMMDKRK